MHKQTSVRFSWAWKPAIMRSNAIGRKEMAAVQFKATVKADRLLELPEEAQKLG